MVKICGKPQWPKQIAGREKQDFSLWSILGWRWSDPCWRKIGKSFLNNESKHPILLPKVKKITDLLIKHHHKLAGHSGRGITLNEIRSSGYWIVDAKSAVKNILCNCDEFRIHRRRLEELKMANLSSFRFNESVLFTHCGIDMFGPLVSKQRRSEVKRYGANFDYMLRWAIHIEVALKLDTD